MNNLDKTLFHNVLCEVKAFVNGFLGQEFEENEKNINVVTEFKTSCKNELETQVEVQQYIARHQKDLLNIAYIDGMGMSYAETLKPAKWLLKPLALEEAYQMCTTLLDLRSCQTVVLDNWTLLPSKIEKKSRVSSENLLSENKEFYCKKAFQKLIRKAINRQKFLIIIHFEQ